MVESNGMMTGEAYRRGHQGRIWESQRTEEMTL